MPAMDSQENSNTMMQIIPDNSNAKKLFMRCYEHVNHYKDDFHAKFMVKLPIADDTNDEPVESDTDYESTVEGDSEEQYEGFYNISAAEELGPKSVQLGWRIGKGHHGRDSEHRMVDILLAKPADQHSKTLPSIVCRLILDEQLGILVVWRPDRSRGDIMIKLDDSWEVFAHGEKRPLYKKSSWLRAGNCDYEFRYTVQPSQREQFLAQRVQILGVMDKDIPPSLPTLTYVPGDPTWSNGKYVRLGTIGSGTFGYVREGFSTNSSQRIAIKELRLQKESESNSLLNELDIMRRLQVSNPSTSLISLLTNEGF